MLTMRVHKLPVYVVTTVTYKMYKVFTALLLARGLMARRTCWLGWRFVNNTHEALELVEVDI